MSGIFSATLTDGKPITFVAQNVICLIELPEETAVVTYANEWHVKEPYRAVNIGLYYALGEEP